MELLILHLLKPIISMQLKDRIFLEELLEQFRYKIIDEWHEKWQSFGDFTNFSSIQNKNAFLDELLFDIQEILKQKIGLIEAAQITISKDFLRRQLFETPKNNYLQERSLRVLSIYLGYDNWLDFKQKNTELLDNQPITVNIVQVFNSLVPGIRQNHLMLSKATDWDNLKVPPKPKIYQIKYWLLGIILLSLISFGCYKGYELYQNRPFTAEQLAGVKFYISKENGEGLPHEVFISYDISSLGDVKDAKVSFGRQDDYALNKLAYGLPDNEIGELNELWKPLKSSVGIVSHIYYLPINVNIKLSIRGQVIKTFAKVIWSGGKWMAVAQSFANKWESFAYPEEWLIKKGELTFPRELLEDPKNREDYLPSLFRVAPYNVDGDEVFVEVRMKNPMDITGIRCLGTFIMLMDTTERAVATNFVSKGCSSYGKVLAGNLIFHGFATQGELPNSYDKQNGIERKCIDLSGIGIDNTEKFSVFGIKTLNKDVFIYIDNKEVFRSKYKGEMSKIIRIMITSKVTSYIDWVKLSNSKTGKVVFFDDFSR